MMEKQCRCGASKKRFMMDIGPFYVAECCETAGYDHLGRKPDLDALLEDVTKKADAPRLLELKNQSKSPIPKLGRGRLMDTRVDELKAMAKAKGVEGADGMTKRQLVEELLK